MNTPVRTVVFLGTVIVVGIGAFWLGQEHGSADTLPLKTQMGDTLQENRRLQAEITRLAAENHRLAAQRATLEPATASMDVAAVNAPRTFSPMERLRVLTELQTSLMIVDEQSGKLQIGGTRLLNLTPAETDTLQRATDQARQQIEQLMATNATVSRRADGAVVISVTPFDGGTIRDGLTDAFAQVLGPDGKEAFLAPQEYDESYFDQISRALDGFGTQPRTITLSHATSPNGITPLLSVREEQKNPATGKSKTTTFEVNVESIPATLNWVLPLVPPDF